VADENGVHDYDEINRFKPGSNSGWNDLTGPKSRKGSIGQLVKLGKKARYVDPQLSWMLPVAPTDIEFYAGDAMGAGYKNSMFVGDLHGSIYRFDLSADRKNLSLEGELLDRIVDGDSEADGLRMGSGFGIVTDLVSRPDGLYVLSLNGSLNRISVGDGAGLAQFQVSARAVPEPGGVLLMLVAMGVLARPLRGEQR
jgi:glucose/arabinose dehydrogenase